MIFDKSFGIIATVLVVLCASVMCTKPHCPPVTAMTSAQDSLIADEEDCHKYYHCDHGVPYSRECATNLVFNPNIRVSI